jgi:D-alanyl-D-alanine carboxypeptidase
LFEGWRASELCALLVSSIPPLFRGNLDGEKVLRTLSAFWLRRIALALATITFVVSGNPSGNSAFANAKYAGIVIDAKTGKTLYSYKADAIRYPASLTKMMTMYMMFEAFADRKMTKKTRIRMSKYAVSKPPSKLYIKAGRSIAAEHAVYALATKSANDVAAAVAEHLGGTEGNFAKMMTRKARQLGMKNTTFKNASGLTSRGQLTTARDMARLGVALREHFPQYYKYFQTRNFKYAGKNYRNHNRLLGQIRGVDGIKTGYTRASGFNLVSSVQSGRRSIVAVVLGGRSGKSRNAQMAKLIKRYLPKASRGNKRQLVASRKSSSFVVASAPELRLPKRGPVPQFRTTQVAKATINVQKPVTVASAASFKQTSVQKRLAQAVAPVPVTKPTSEVAYVDPITTGNVATKPSGWVIQIGAAGDKNGAFSLLKKAQAKFPQTLGSKKLYSETVTKGSSVLYRARFVGFSGKAEARRACKILKKKRFACLALNS